MYPINIKKQLLDILETGSPLMISFILIVSVIVWLLPKSKDVGGWKELFSKNRTEEMRKAKELLAENKEEAAFYEEAMRQELFQSLIGIRCRKEYREMLQRLVIDGTASTEGIRLAYLFLYRNDSKIEVRFGWLDWIWASILALLCFLGIIGISQSLSHLLRNVNNPHTGTSRLLGLSVATLFFFGALKGLLPMATALVIKKRLKKLEAKNREHAVSPPEQVAAAGEQDAQGG